MRYAIQWLRSLVFNFQMYLTMFLFALFFAPLSLIDQKWAFTAVRTYCLWVRWSARWLVGLHSEIRGEVPQDRVIVASKHQSFFDIIMIVSVVPRIKFIMKKEILWTPLVGFYAKRLECIAVDRGKRSVAIKKMVAAVTSDSSKTAQLIIFPQGTRVAAGDKKPYKVGVGVLYKETAQDCVPAATNVGVFWRRHGIMRYPGTAVLEFLPRIEQGLEIEEFMTLLEEQVETHSDNLSEEARQSGWNPH